MAKNKHAPPALNNPPHPPTTPDELGVAAVEAEQQILTQVAEKQILLIVGEVFGGPVLPASRLYEDLLFDVFDRDDVVEAMNKTFRLQLDQDDPRLDNAKTVADLCTLVEAERKPVTA
jgi:acyl carrier protein